MRFTVPESRFYLLDTCLSYFFKELFPAFRCNLFFQKRISTAIGARAVADDFTHHAKTTFRLAESPKRNSQFLRVNGQSATLGNFFLV